MTDSFDPKLPIVLEGATPQLCDIWWENVAKIPLETRAGWWGEALQDPGLKIGSDYVDYTPDGLVSNSFLDTKAAKALAATVSPLAKLGISNNVSAESFNPLPDRLETELTVVQDGETRIIITTQSLNDVFGREGLNGIKDVINDGEINGVKDIINDSVTLGIKDVINDE